jgi:CheY-like chemotaxis protein/two-component sensor histidine kinase
MSINGTAAGSIAHDLNNGLQALLLSTLLNDERLTTSRIQDIARDLRQSAAYCRALLAMVGEEPHARSEDAEPIDLSEALGRIREVLPFFIGSAATASIEIAKGCRAAMHESDLQRIVVNLAANARDAMPHGGTLHIRLSREGERVVLEVKDDGIGMDERTRARAFEPFFTTKPAGQGTGLGLHATSQIVTDTHGTITCTSELGVGTSFRLSWPAVAVAHIQTAAPLHPEEPVIRGRILVAEDEPMVRGVITQALRAVGYDVVEAGDGDAALAMVEGGRSWIALCIDGVMPGHASADIIDSFVSRNPGRPVLLCSGHLPKELERRRLANAAVSFLPKPFSPTELQGALANAIAKCATRQAS